MFFSRLSKNFAEFADQNFVFNELGNLTTAQLKGEAIPFMKTYFGREVS